MRKKEWLLLFSILSSVGVIAMMPFLATWSGQDLNRPSGQDTEGRLVGSYTLRSLKNSSDLIIVGTVARNVTSYGSSEQGVVDTLFTLSVMRYVKGSGTNEINVTDVGGTLNGLTVNRQDSPLIELGKTYILFLSSRWQCAPSPPSPPCVLPPSNPSSTHLIVGGPQGKFLVNSGRVYGYKTLNPDEDYFLNVDANGVSVDSFVAEVLAS